MESFGTLLRQLRKEHKVTQRQLADRVGIDFTYISKIESGTMDPPAEDKLCKIAEVFQIDPESLILAAKKVPTSFQQLIMEHKDVPLFLRKAPALSPSQWQRIKAIMNEQGSGDEQ